MKKIFLFCAALVAAININADLPEMTCAQAKQYALDNLQSGETATDSVAVIGYVTKDYSGISRGQQRFSMDDVKGSVETFHCYYANMPAGEAALNVGDKVKVKGLIANYNGGAQFKNGDVDVIIERVTINIDTIPSNVCEVIEEGESLNDQEKTSDYFTVEAVVSSIKTEMNQYGQESFWMVCETNEKELQAYNVVMEDNIAAEVGDRVFVIGKIQKYGTTIELVSGSAKVLEKGHVVVDTLLVNVAQAVAAGRELAQGKTSIDIYVVEGYADSIAFAFSEASQNMSFYMCDDMENPTYDFEAYKVSTTQDVPVGTKVYVMGKLYHYYKAATDEKPEVDLIEISEGKLFFYNPLGIENIVLTEKAQKVVVDGVVYIIRDNKMFNTLGTQVK